MSENATKDRELYAFFDFDKTIARGDSIVPYLLYCMRRGYAPKNQLFKAVHGTVLQRLPGQDPMRGKKSALAFIHGKTHAEMDEVARSFFNEDHLRRFYRDARNEITRLKDEGYHVIVVSASAAVYMRMLPEFLPIDDVLCTECGDSPDHCYSGDIGINCKGDEKVRRIGSYLKEKGLTRELIHMKAYGDSSSDIPMLNTADQAYLINPKKKTAQACPKARILSWE